MVLSACHFPLQNSTSLRVSREARSVWHAGDGVDTPRAIRQRLRPSIWAARPLAAEHVKYTAADVVALFILEDAV